MNEHRGIIAWFAANPVAANLLMVVILGLGAYSLLTVKKETFPKIEPNRINIEVPYLGAAPQEVEEGVLIKIEEAVQDIEGIKELRSYGYEGRGLVVVETQSDYDLDEVMDKVELRVGAISTFPEETERPIISRQNWQNEVIWITVSGDELSERQLKERTEALRDDLITETSITKADVIGARNYEISIEVSEEDLRAYGLTFEEVVRAVRGSSLDLPGGSIRAEGGDILLRAKGQAYRGTEFEDIVLRTRADGTRLLLGDVAEVKDSFVESEAYLSYNRRTALGIRVMSVGSQSELAISDQVKQFIERKQALMPEGVHIASWADSSYYLKGRLELMTKNLLFGALLVFIVLAMFLRLKVALWVMVGIPVSFLGAFAFMPMFDVSINMVSLFAFILVLGVVVDDAIIIGESVYTQIRSDGHTLDNVIRGAHRVAMPALFGVLTTIAAFLPLLFVGGDWSKIWQAMGLVVILCLIFSIVESKLILPAHLAEMKLTPLAQQKDGLFKRFGGFQRIFSNGLEDFIDKRFTPFSERALKNRYITLGFFVAAFICSMALLAGGVVRQVGQPEIAGDFIQGEAEMAQGSSDEQLTAALQRMEDAIFRVDQQMAAEQGMEPGAVVQHVIAWRDGDREGNIFVELAKIGEAEYDAKEILRRWREETGEIPGARHLGFDSAMGPGGGPVVNFRLVGRDVEQVNDAADELVAMLQSYEGLFDVRTSYDSGPPEIKLSIKPEAQALGLSLEDLARQVRYGFYGAEAQRIQRGQDDVRVMVRYPQEERQSPAHLRDMRLRTASGEEVPFSQVADIEWGTSYDVIRRVDRQRAITVTADGDKEKVEPGRIVNEVIDEFVPRLEDNFPGVAFKLQGASEEDRRMQRRLMLGSVIALLGIYVLVAIPLRSYVQPLLIMSVIPFGLVGAIVGHAIVGLPMSVPSYLGLIALAGVVVNDSIILVDFINRARQEGMALWEACVSAGTKRFRAILLTSLTTFFGLLPIILEKSAQAQFIIPMAVSLAFGILFATVITLLMVPALYLIFDDLKAYFSGEDMLERFRREEQASLQQSA